MDNSAAVEQADHAGALKNLRLSTTSARSTTFATASSTAQSRRTLSAYATKWPTVSPSFLTTQCSSSCASI
eukprot:4195957-Pleurochrysis_carterae.AAC.1